MSRSFSNLDLFTSILAGTATIAVTVISQQANAIAKSTQEIAQVAQTTTVQINNSLGDPGGTGVIVAKQGNTYTVLTANHVVRSTDAQYTLATHTEKQYQASKVQRLQSSKEDPDLALVTFSSPDEYPVAPIADSDRAVIGADIYVCGYPLPSIGAGKERDFTFSPGIVSSRPKTRPQGYTFYIIRSTVRILQENFQGALEDIERSLKIDPNNYASYFIRGTLRFQQGNNQAGLEDINQSLKINPNYADALRLRASIRFQQGDEKGASEDINLALTNEPKNADAYVVRAGIRTKQKDNPGAIEDINKALSIEPENADAYELRAGIRLEQGDNKGAIEDLDELIKIKPNYADAYLGRGAVRYQLKDKQGALADFQKGAELYQQQGNTQSYQQVQELIKKLQQEL